MKFQSIRQAASSFYLKSTLVAYMGFVYPIKSFAEENITLPDITIAGVNDNDSGDTRIIKIFKYGGRLFLYGAVIVSLIALIVGVIKSINKEHRDENARWGNVVRDVGLHVVFTIVSIVLALWANKYLA